MLTKTKPLYSGKVVTAGKRKDNSAKATRKNAITGQERTVSTRNVVQGERMVNLEKKPKRVSVKRKDQQVVSYDRKKVAFSGRQVTTRQVKTLKQNAAQAEERRDKKYNSQQVMETRKQDKGSASGRQERYSMNHSGPASLSSLSNRRERF